MTFLKTALMSAAAFAIAAPTFAADGHMDKKTDATVKVTTTATMTDQEVAMMKKKQMDAMRKKHMESMGITTTQSIEMDSKTTIHTDTMHPSKVNDTIGEILQADGEPSIQTD